VSFFLVVCESEFFMSKLKGPLTVFASVIVVVIGLASIKALQFNAMAEASLSANPSPAVTSYVVDRKDWQSYFDTVGTVRSDEGITVSAELSGRVQSINFQSGDEVKAGALLLTQDDSNEAARLKAAQAQLRLAKYNFEQVSRLRSQNTVSENEFETIKQALDSAEANVLNIESDVSKKRIVAPFDGVLGIRKVDLGEDLQEGSKIVDLYSHKNLKIDFTVPQTWINKVQVGNQVEINLIEQTQPVYTGKINAIGSAIDETTRSIEVQASIDSKTDSLLPGMAVEIRIVATESESALTIPAQSIIYAPYGDTVFVIDEDESGILRVKQQFIQISKRRGDFVSVSSGLEAGQRVVHAGAFKLFPGQTVKISDLSDGPLTFSPDVTNE
jgi:membrane fusion protein (multidrug efflux system)